MLKEPSKDHFDYELEQNKLDNSKKKDNIDPNEVLDNVAENIAEGFIGFVKKTVKVIDRFE